MSCFLDSVFIDFSLLCLKFILLTKINFLFDLKVYCILFLSNLIKVYVYILLKSFDKGLRIYSFELL